MFMLCELRKVDSMASLDNTKGAIGQIAEDSATGNLYIKHGGSWQQLTSNGAQGGNAAAHANTAVVVNGASMVLQTSGGVTSTSTATLKSPVTATVAAGAVTNVKASA